LEAVNRDKPRRADPILEQLKQCPEAFKAGEMIAKMLDSLKYSQGKDPAGDRHVPARRCSRATPRLIGLPIATTIPESPASDGGSARGGMKSQQRSSDKAYCRLGHLPTRGLVWRCR